MNRRRDAFSGSRSRSRGGRGRCSRSCSRSGRGGRGGRGDSYSLEGSPRRFRGRGGPRRGRSFSEPRGGRGMRGPPGRFDDGKPPGRFDGPPGRFDEHRGNGGDRKGSKGKGKGDDRDDRGPWDCPNPSCKFTGNYAGRQECHRCKAPRPRSRSPGSPPPGQFTRTLTSSKAAGAPPGQNYDYYQKGPQASGGAPGAPGAAYGGQGGAGAPQGGTAAWGGQQHYQPQRDYASEKPQAYAAFLAHIRHGVEGIEVFLGNRMCQDHHVDDLLACLESFLARSLPRPWRIGRLDLARNGLTDDSVKRIIERMKLWSLRVKRLDLDTNFIGHKALTALVEYVWNCPEPILDLGLAENSIQGKTAEMEEDAVSALLRCLYNHPGYPLKTQTGTTERPVQQIVPMTLRLHDNRITDIQALIDDIRDKGGASHVRFCLSADPYTPTGEEFLSACLPFYDRQNGPPVAIAGGAGGAPAMTAIQDAVAAVANAQQPMAAGNAGAGSEVSESYTDSEYSPIDNGQLAQAVPVAPVVKDLAAVPAPHQHAFAPAVGGAMSDDESCSYSDEDSLEAPRNDAPPPNPEVSKAAAEAAEAEVDEDESDEDEEQEEDENKAAEDMAKALDILEAAADAQERAARIEPAAPNNADADVDSDESVDIASNAQGGPEEPVAAAPADAASPSSSASPARENNTGVGASDPDGLPEPQGTRAAASKRRAKPPQGATDHRASATGTPPKLPVSRLKERHFAEGKVTLLRERFALVDFGAQVEGMLHLDGMLGTPMTASDALSLGDLVQVRVSGICTRRKRVSLEQVNGRPASQAASQTAETGLVRVKRRRKVRRSQKRPKGEAAAPGGPSPFGNGNRDEESAVNPLAAASGKAKSRPKRRHEDPKALSDEDAPSAKDSFGGVVQEMLTAEEQGHLERDVVAEIDKTDLNMEAEDKAELGELVLGLLKEGKRPSQIETELSELIPADTAAKFTAWLVDHIKGKWLRAAHGRAGASAKASAKKPES